MAMLHRAAGWDGLLLAFATLLAGVHAGIVSRLRQAGLARQRSWRSMTMRMLSRQRATAVQSGPKAVNVALNVALDGGDETQNALFLVTERDGHWGIQGRSIFAAA